MSGHPLRDFQLPAFFRHAVTRPALSAVRPHLASLHQRWLRTLLAQRRPRNLLYLSEDRKLMAVSVGPGPSFGVPKPLFQTRVLPRVSSLRTSYVPSRDPPRRATARRPRWDEKWSACGEIFWGSWISKLLKQQVVPRRFFVGRPALPGQYPDRRSATQSHHGRAELDRRLEAIIPHNPAAYKEISKNPVVRPKTESRDLKI